MLPPWAIALVVVGALLATVVVVLAGFLLISTGCERPVRRRRKHRLTECLREVSAVLEEHQVHYYIEFGTLLGHVRDGGVIEGDNDVDMGVIVGGQDDVDRLLGALRALRATGGYRVQVDGYWARWESTKWANTFGDMYLLTPNADGKTLRNRNTERATYADYSLAHILPTRLEPFGCVDPSFQVRVPAHPEEVLLERYGPTWRTPIPSGKSIADGGSDEARRVVRARLLRAVVTWRDMLEVKYTKQEGFVRFASADGVVPWTADGGFKATP